MSEVSFEVKLSEIQELIDTSNTLLGMVVRIRKVIDGWENGVVEDSGVLRRRVQAAINNEELANV